MEMELCKGEIQAHCTDLLDSTIALVRSALSVRDCSFIKNNVELTTYNQEQYDCLDKIIDDVMTNFTDYYYVAGENYTEHPYYGVTLVEGEPLYDYHEKYYDNNPIFKIEYEKLADTTTRVMFSIKDKDKCLQALDEYCSSYGYDSVYNNEQNILTCEAKDKQLYNLLTENDYNLSNFVVNDIKYIKALCYNEYAGKLGISNVYLGFDEANKLAFRCTIVADDFVENYGKDDVAEKVLQEDKVKASKPKKARKHFSPRIQELFDYIKTYADARDYMIYPSELIGDRPEKVCEDMGNLTSMVKRLNIQYQEMIQDETVSLMKYDRTLECYVIKDIWNN